MIPQALKQLCSLWCIPESAVESALREPILEKLERKKQYEIVRNNISNKRYKPGKRH